MIKNIFYGVGKADIDMPDISIWDMDLEDLLKLDTPVNDLDRIRELYADNE